MLEGLVTWVLNNYLGKYVENLNTDQLSIALLSGEVELENLPLRREALRHLGLPVEVRAGFLGKVRLQVPVRQIRSAPWVIQINQLYLVAAPVNLAQWDSEAEECLSQEYKLGLLDALEAQWRAEHEVNPDSGYYATSISSWMSYGTSLITNIIENLQLKINDVHIRYEDPITCGENNAFACGLIMESFCAESCDSNWVKSFTTLSSSGGGCSFKLLELDKMAFYWDRMKPEDMVAHLSLADLSVKMSNINNGSHDFIISPVSAFAQLRRERTELPLRSHTRPRLTCQLQLENVNLILNNRQYNEMMGCERGLSLIGKLRAFKRWRPNITPKEDAKAWWTYAVKCHFPDATFMDEHPTWDRCLERSRMCVRYVSLYATQLATPTCTLPSQDKVFKEHFEWISSFQQLKLLRECAVRRMPRKNRRRSTEKDITSNSCDIQGRSLLMSWFPQWWGWYGSQEGGSTDSGANAEEQQPSLEGEILDVLADSIENNTLLRRDTVFGRFKFSLNKGSLQLCEAHSHSHPTTHNKVKLELQFESVGFSVESRPRTSSHCLNIALGAVYLRDYCTENTLFPVLIAPQGTIRESLGVGVKFTGQTAPNWVKSSLLGSGSGLSGGATSPPPSGGRGEPLFQLVYEKKPPGANADYRLFVKCQSLEIVYNPTAVRWLVDFLSRPLEKEAVTYAQVKHTTKMHLINQWEHFLKGNLSEKSLWQLELQLDISAPQILLIEKFTDRNSVMVLIDFGKMYLTNGLQQAQSQHQEMSPRNMAQTSEDPITEDDDNEMFMTPCSTPPGSEASDVNLTECGTSPLPTDPPITFPAGGGGGQACGGATTLDQDTLHNRLYERYKVELSDLQVLVGRVRDNWKYANTKGTSSLHVLDKFNISLQLERRLIYTSDPQFPSLTLCGTLPNLVVHINEHKLLSIQSLVWELNHHIQMPSSTSFSTMPLNEDLKISPPVEEDIVTEYTETDFTEKSCNQMSRLLMLQFHIDQMALEVQSRGRSIAEVQVCGVRASFTKRPFDYSLSLSVHSLLLVDALQTYGPDFELLIASHKHVGMDSVSGSMRDSEPTSPTSPSSPPPPSSAHPPAPAILSQALRYLNTSSSFSKQQGAGRWCVSPTLEAGSGCAAGIVDSEALIVLEVMVVSAHCPTNQGEELRVANILFNNLDIIANQETIVELIGFTKRVTSIHQPMAPKRIPSESKLKLESGSSAEGSLDQDECDSEMGAGAGITVRTEVTFDFHRLSVLLLRATLHEGELVAKKIATATMSDARIQATVANNNNLELNGSLGGLQVVSLCSDVGVHSRIVSVGIDPNNYTSQSLLATTLTQELYYKGADLRTTHNHALSFHITRCHQDYKAIEAIDVEAKEEISVGISIHMASVWYTHSGVFISELQSCATQFTQYLSNLAKSIKAAATDMAIGLVQPRSDSLYSNPRVAGSTDWSTWSSLKRPRSISIAVPQIYESTCDLHSPAINLKVEVVLDTPVIVLPRSASSPQVFVGHLGNISISNRHHLTNFYNIHVRDINVYSLNVSSHLNRSCLVNQSVEAIYSCGSDGKPILHDTSLHFTVERTALPKETHSDPMPQHCIQIIGKVVTPLVVSASRCQYEQLLDTVSLMAIPSTPHNLPTSHHHTALGATDMDGHQHKQMYSPPPTTNQAFQQVKVNFQLPIFTVELRGDFGQGERSLVDLSFRDFFVNYDKCQVDKTNVEMSLRSITMEDLSRSVDSRHRFMMLSHKPAIPKATYVSKSCPDLTLDEDSPTTQNNTTTNLASVDSSSLPDYLYGHNVAPKVSKLAVGKQEPAQENLVLISIEFRDVQQEDFKEKYNNVRKVTKVDFNSLDLVVSVDSWVVVLDFFGMGSDEEHPSAKKNASSTTINQPQDMANEEVGVCEMEMSVRSLNIVLLRPDREVCRANISGLEVLILNGPQNSKQISGMLHSMSLTDLTQHGRIWRERFLSSGKEALSFHYERFKPEDAVLVDCDTRLLIEMSSIIYIHTKRFVAEITSFFREFSRLQSVLSSAHQKVSVTANSRSTRLQLSIKCLAPAILVPVSSASTSVLVADLGKLMATNVFKRSGSVGTISSLNNPNDPVSVLLDVMTIHLDNMDLYCGERVSDVSKEGEEGVLSLGHCSGVLRRGPCLLTHKCGLTLQVERNLEEYHNVADMTIQGTLDTLDGSIDLTQYKVIKGLLSNNLGENIDELSQNIVLQGHHSSESDVQDQPWTLTSIRLELLNVTLCLETEHATPNRDGASLACINFIKSHLLVETYSDMTQDIDLVSQEILVSDTRYKAYPVNKRFNVFTNIVQPIGLKMDHNGLHSVQAEVHARKRKEHSAYTILVNNMRLMAIIDWWQAVNEFIMSPPTPNTITILDLPTTRSSQREHAGGSRQAPVSENTFELKLNITESQVVFVEDTSQWDTNTVILKSTTVISYKPGSEPKPLSCVLNHCEVFSCVLGMEDETALSIIDPVTVQIDLNSSKVLQVQIPQLSVRLSYHDVKMLLKMSHSLPQQTRSGRLAAQDNTSSSKVYPLNQEAFLAVPANVRVDEGCLRQLISMGFSHSEGAWALARCANSVEQAALLLAEQSLHSPPSQPKSLRYLPVVPHQLNPDDGEIHSSFNSIHIKADCMSLCVIDDCRDCDVPLVEISLSEMNLVQDMRAQPPCNLTSPPLLLSTPALPSAPPTPSDSEPPPGGGRLQCKLTSDYYNRALSGWEPFIEPWRCEASWEYGLSLNLKRNRLQVEVNSTERLNVNMTSSLVELYSVVKTSWSQDYYSPRSSPPGPRRRSPFVPFALLNQTGLKLSFTTLVSSPDMVNENIPLLTPDSGGWMEVASGDTCPFTFGARGKQRHRDSHKLRLHQLAVHMEGWGPIQPVCVDKVGVLFRQATHIASDIEARVVFSVSLEGSARKLVTVRSALQLINQLPETIEVRADNVTIKASSSWATGAISRNVCIKSGDTWCVPLSHNPTPMWIRPICVGGNMSTCSYLYCAQPLDWRLAARQAPEDTIQLPHCCHSNTQASYRFCCIMKREAFPMERGLPQPGHILILKPPVRLVNLLPVELNYKLSLSQGYMDTGRIAPGQTAPLSQVDVQKNIEIHIFMENFPGAGTITITPAITTSFSCKLRLSDMTQRKLMLNAYVSIKRSDSIKVSISAPYWIINRTGVPIVFRQEGVVAETAGQFEEHEIARMVAPLMFSFADSDGSPTVVARVGAGVIPNGQRQWCSPFGLGVGVMVRRLVVGGNGERALLVGIAIRPGKGRYRYTNICTISPRFQIHNNTSFHLQFAQKCYATIMNDPGASMTQVSAIPGCSMPFHWPRPDRDQLLCVRILDLPNCTWSGGFRVDMNHSLHINVRDNSATCFFLRLEVVLQGATYFIVFTDADTMPPPIRLDNYSLVQLKFHQVGCKEEYLLKAHSSKPWALVEACGAGALGIKAPGGTGTTVDLHKLDTQKSITYQNFIYIAFTGTHLKPVEAGGSNVESLQLVLCAWGGANSGGGRVVLGRRREAERAQLWRLSPQGHLLHEGSSPPQPANSPPDITAPHALVLDIEGSAVQPGCMVGLCLRRVNPRRSSTQTWNFTWDGRLTCAHRTMCVQPQDGFFGLREGARAVLGMPGNPGPHLLANGVPIEQAVSSQTLRPGSGFLSITVETDGPTRVVKIIDSKLKEENWCEGRAGDNILANSNTPGASTGEVQVRLAVKGVGVSIVQKVPPLELVYAHHKGVLLETIWTPTMQALNLSVQDMQYDNQLLGTPCPVLLHSTRLRGLPSSSSSSGIGALPIVQVSVERTTPSSPRQRAHIFQHFLLTLRPLSLHLEERLLLLLAQWFGLASQAQQQVNEDPDESDFEAQKILTEVTAAHAKRYYFRVLKLQPSQIRLSMQTAGKLPPKLGALKKRLGVTLIKFEDAGVELEPFVRMHPFETSQFLWHAILKHYKDELKWQAAIILGSVDFLGNPLGFVQDVSDGVSGLIYEGNVGALVKNVTHGLSNSAAKVTESLGDGLGRVILDEAHEETRARIRGVGSGGEVGPSGHLAAGLRGLGLGLLGGMTSLVKHSYEGAQHQGLPGFLAGVGKGLVGTLTKPVVGVLDLAAETAAALRDTSRSGERWIPERLRPPRCPIGPGGLLPRYSRSQSLGRQLLYTITQTLHAPMEVFLAYDTIRSHPYDIRALVSTTHLRIFTCTSGEPHIVIESHLSNIVLCQAVSGTVGEHYIELVVRGEGGSGHVRRPQVQCDTGDQARWVTHQLNYAKSMYQETLYTLQENELVYD